jgi:hypothetical protein
MTIEDQTKSGFKNDINNYENSILDNVSITQPSKENTDIKSIPDKTNELIL